MAVAAAADGNAARAVELFLAVREGGHALEERTYYAIINACLGSADRANARALLADMLDAGFHVRARTWTWLLDCDTWVNDEAAAMAVVGDMAGRGVPDAHVVAAPTGDGGGAAVAEAAGDPNVGTDGDVGTVDRCQGESVPSAAAAGTGRSAGLHVAHGDASGGAGPAPPDGLPALPPDGALAVISGAPSRVSLSRLSGGGGGGGAAPGDHPHPPSALPPSPAPLTGGGRRGGVHSGAAPPPVE